MFRATSTAMNPDWHIGYILGDEQVLQRRESLLKLIRVHWFGSLESRIRLCRILERLRQWYPAHHALTASTIDKGLSVAMTRDSRKPAPCSSLANSAFVRSRPRGVSTSISKSSSLP